MSDSRERFIAYINSLKPDRPIDYDAMWQAAERQALERALKECKDINSKLAIRALLTPPDGEKG